MNKTSEVKTIRIAGVVRESIVDGPGIRFVVFTQGCPHRCQGCQNPQSHDFSAGYDSKIENIIAEIEKDPLLCGVTFSGGEPFSQPAELLVLAKEIVSLPKKLDIIIYTGYLIEELLEMGKETPQILELIGLSNIIVDGKFILAQLNLNLLFRGSANQRIIDAKASLKQGRAITKEFDQ